MYIILGMGKPNVKVHPEGKIKSKRRGGVTIDSY